MEFNIGPPKITSLQKTKNAANSKTYVFLIAINQQNIIITRERFLEERKSVPLI